MSDKNIYQILESLDAAQRGVKQLPALFRPKDTSPQLSGPYPGRNATQGYLVGEGDETGWGSETGDSGADETPDGVSPDTQSFLDEIGIDPNRHPQTRDYGRGEEENTMHQAVTRRIVNQHPEWITRYGVEFLMQVIDDVTEGEDDWEEIGSSDVSAFVNMVGDQLRDRAGSREEMQRRKPFTEGIKLLDQDYDLDQMIYQLEVDGQPVSFTYWDYEYDFQNPDVREIYAQVKNQLRQLSPEQQKAVVRIVVKSLKKTVTRANKNPNPSPSGMARNNKNLKPISSDLPVEKNLAQSATTEDVISTVKKKLGDYLSDLSKEIKSDPDLKDKLERDIDQIGPAVKTLKTDDGHEIKIHGNEDDGFRISIRNREAETRFKDLDEATMAVEMYCARRRGAAMEKDYLEER